MPSKLAAFYLAIAAPLLLAACTTPTPSHAWPVVPGNYGGSVNPCLNDGSASAPSGGAMPLSSVFPGTYVATSTCAVYGITAAVGQPSGSGTTDPTTYGWTAPYSYSASDKSVRCDDNGTPPPVIDGFDFTLHGGIGFEDASCHTGATGPVIQNSKFLIGSNCVTPIFQGVTAIGMKLLNNKFDGGSLANIAACGRSALLIANLQGSGPYVIRYNDCGFAPQHCVNFNGLGGAIDLCYNLVRSNGWGQGPHADDLFIMTASAGTTYSPVNVCFNTAYNPQPTVGIAETPTGTFTSGSSVFTTTDIPSVSGFNDNSLDVGATITSTKLPVGTKIVSASTSGTAPSATTTITVDHNATSSGTALFDIPLAYPSNGIPLFFIAQGGGNIANATVDHNTLIAVGGGVQTAATMAYCGPKNDGQGSTMTNITWGKQFFDLSGAVTAFSNDPAPYDCPNGSNGNVVSSSVNMNTGATITPLWAP